MRAASETWEDNNGGAVDMHDNRYGKQGQWLRQRWTSTVEEMQDNRYGYSNGLLQAL